MLSGTELKTLYMRAERLTDLDLERGLQLALAEQDYQQQHPEETYPTDRLEAWIMALRMEQARRAGKLRTLTDADGNALARLWPQIAHYRDALIKLGLEVHLRIDEITENLIRVQMTISGEVDKVNTVANQWEKIEVPAGSKIILKNRGIEHVGSTPPMTWNDQFGGIDPTAFDDQ